MEKGDPAYPPPTQEYGNPPPYGAQQSGYTYGNQPPPPAAYPPPAAGQPAGYPPPPPGQPAGYGAPAGQAYPVHQQVQPVTNTTTVVTMTGGGCRQCGVGTIVEDYSTCGIILAICFFPWGIICCLMMKERRCTNCGAMY